MSIAILSITPVTKPHEPRSSPKALTERVIVTLIDPDKEPFNEPALLVMLSGEGAGA